MSGLSESGFTLKRRPFADIPKRDAPRRAVSSSIMLDPLIKQRPMKQLSTLAALIALTSLSAFAEDKPEAKPEAKAETKSEPAKPAADAKPEKPKPTPEDRFKKLDKDGNGSLSLDEFRGKKEASEVEEAFKKLDTNGDGAISLEEFLAGSQKKKKKE